MINKIYKLETLSEKLLHIAAAFRILKSTHIQMPLMRQTADGESCKVGFLFIDID